MSSEERHKLVVLYVSWRFSHARYVTFFQDYFRRREMDSGSSEPPDFSDIGNDLIANLTVQGYYRDDRVMLSLGMEPRPPHPDGYEVEQGDWSLLDPVRQRDEFYRRTD